MWWRCHRDPVDLGKEKKEKKKQKKTKKKKNKRKMAARAAVVDVINGAQCVALQGR